MGLKTTTKHVTLKPSEFELLEVDARRDAVPLPVSVHDVYQCYSAGLLHGSFRFTCLRRDNSVFNAETVTLPTHLGYVITGPIESIAVSPDGQPIVTCRLVKMEKAKEHAVITAKTLSNKYYVASPNVTKDHEQAEPHRDQARLAIRPNSTGRWTRHTMADAVAHAERLLELDPTLDHVAVSQIVRIVRRKKAPVIVETVRG